MPKKTKEAAGPVLADVDTGSRVRIEAEVVGQGGNIGRAVQVGHWRGPVAVSIPVQVLSEVDGPTSLPQPEMAQGDLRRLVDVPAGRRVLVEVEVIGGKGLLGGTRVRIGDRDDTMPDDAPVWELADESPA